MKKALVFLMLIVASSPLAFSQQYGLLLNNGKRNFLLTRGNYIEYKVGEDHHRYNAVIEQVDSFTVTLLTAGQPPFNIPIKNFSHFYLEKTGRTASLGRQAAVVLPAAALILFGIDALNSNSRGENWYSPGIARVCLGFVAAGIALAVITRDHRVHIGKKGWSAKSVRLDGLEKMLDAERTIYLPDSPEPEPEPNEQD